MDTPKTQSIVHKTVVFTYKRVSDGPNENSRVILTIEEDGEVVYTGSKHFFPEALQAFLNRTV